MNPLAATLYTDHREIIKHSVVTLGKSTKLVHTICKVVIKSSLPQFVDPIRYSVHLDGHRYYGNQEEQDH